MVSKGETEKLDCWGNFIETILTFNTRVWARYGNFVGAPFGATLMFLFGSAIVTGLAIGIINVEYETNLNNLWIEEGSRAAEELNTYKDYFGGSGRLNLIGYTLAADKGKSDLQPTNTTDHGILTKEAMWGFMNATHDLVHETGKYQVQRTLKSGGVEKTINFTWSDFCTRPMLPSNVGSFTPAATAPNPAPTSPALYNAWATANVGQGIAKSKTLAAGFFFVSSCLAGKAVAAVMTSNLTTVTLRDYVQLQFWMQKPSTVEEILGFTNPLTKAGTVLSQRPGLPAGWGIDRAPCTRSLAVDAFADGIYDYPEGLRQLDEYGFSFLGLSGLSSHPSASKILNGSTSWFESCVSTLSSQLQVMGNTPAEATRSAAIVSSAMSTYSASGYWWRPTIAEVSAVPDYFAKYMVMSINNALTKTAATCVQTGLTRKMIGFKLNPNAPVNYPLPGNKGNNSLVDAATTAALTNPVGCLVNWAAVNMTLPLYIGGLNPSDPTNTTAVRSSNYYYAAALRMSNSGLSTDYKYLLDRLKSEKKLDNAVTTDEATSIVREIEQIMIDKFSDMRDNVVGSGYAEGEKFNQFMIYFLMDRSTSDLFDEAANIEGPLLIGGYLGLIFFSTFNFVLFRCPPNADGWVYSRALLVFSGICTVGGAIAASFGFCGWVGLKLSPVNSTLIPFLAMGLGTGDIFVFVHELYRHRDQQDDPRERITLTMADAGSSLLVSSWANIAGFLIPGGVVKLPAVYTFSLQMGICIILSWITAITMFVPMMTFSAYLNAKRGLCCKAPNSELDSRSVSLDAVWVWFTERALVPLYTNLFFRISMIAGFIAMTTVLGIWGFDKTENGLLLSDVVVRSHYAYDYLKLQEDYFAIMPGSIVTRYINYTNSNDSLVTYPEFQANVLKVLSDTSNTQYIDRLNSPSSAHFLPALIAFFNAQLPTGAPKVTTIPKALFYTTLSGFLSTSGTRYMSDLVCRNMTSNELTDCSQVDGTTIHLEASTGTAYYSGMSDDADYVDAIKVIRKAADKSAGNKDVDNSTLEPIPVFFSGSLFQYWQQYVTIEMTTYKTVGYSLLGVFGITAITQASPLSSILVGVMLFATVIQLYGFMAVLGIKLNGWSATNLGVCVGTSVQTTAYYSYAFLRAHAETPDRIERMNRALVEMFPPLLDGAISSLVSVVVLAFAKFPFFRLYFFVMSCVTIALSFLNGVVFLPCILSFIAPRGFDRAHRAASIATASHLPAKDGLDNNRL